MTASPPRRAIVFLIDVDNTLLDNDAVVADLKSVLTRIIGAERQQRYWAIFEAVRSELGYADYLGALQRYRIEHPQEQHLMAISSFLLNYSFAKRLFPGVLDLISQLDRIGPTVILTDGDVVFQPLKIERSGLGRAVSERILLYIHKERELVDVERRYPAERYVLIDDKVRILADVKAAWGSRVTTVFPRQGHYAVDANVSSYPAPDITVERIGDLLAFDATRWST
ncbi:MAG: HAD family hydrolase [Gemmatimonadales bacterium]